MEQLQELIASIVNRHHLAFRLALLGASEDAPLASVEALVASGAVSVAQLAGWTVPGMRHAVDAFLFLQLVARQMEGAEPGARSRSLEQWATIIDEHLDTVDSPQRLLSPRDAVAHAAALSRAGDFAVGVGQDVAAEIKELTAKAVENRWSAAELAQELAHRSGVFVHNWHRIAQTELQGAYNEGRTYTALDGYGQDAQIARFPESGACGHCLRLFIKDGVPRVFPVEELAANGTNVGRKPADWLPTIWPVHPHCHCDVITVPPGMKVAEDGRLENVE